MSAVPPSFIPQTSFSTLAQQPITSTGLPGSELDGEFSRVSDSVNQIKSRLSEVQRDDGKLRNAVVSTASLSDDVIDLIVTAGTNPITWAIGIQIKVGDLVSNPPGTAGTYLCIVAHTSSSVFANDLANWALIAAPPVVGILYTNTFTGDGSTTAFTLTQIPASKDNTQLYINGVYQQKSSYSLNNAILTITPAPAIAAVIEISIGVPSNTNIVTVADGSISTSKLDTNAVTTVKIAALAVTEAKIADASISSAKLADGAVSTAKITNASVTNAKLAQLSVTSDKVADDSISTSKLAPLSVIGDKIASNTISTTKIQDNAITSAKVADSSVITAKIADNSITESKLDTNAITTAKIADSAVATSKIAAAAVIADKVAAGAITAPKLDGAQTGTAPVFGIRAWVNFDGTVAANIGGTYDRAGSVITIITTVPHGLIVGHKVFLDFTSGTAVDGAFVVTGITSSTIFTVTHGISGATTGAVTLNRRLIRASGNVANVSALGIGQYAVNFTTALPDANYARSGFANYDSGAVAGLVGGDNATTTTAQSCDIFAAGSTNGAEKHFTVVNVMFVG
jgi:hypothetical protein